MSPAPTIGPTRAAHVLTAALVGGGVAYAALTIAQRVGAPLPRVQWTAWASIVVLAVATGVLALQTRRLLRDRRPDLDARSAVRRLLLAKTSILAATTLGAAYAALAVTAWAAWPAPLAVERVLHGGGAVVAALAWALAGAALERACRLPDPPDDEPRAGGHPDGDTP